MKEMNKILHLLLFSLVLSGLVAHAIELELSLSPDPSRAEDFLIIKHPDRVDTPSEPLEFLVETSTDLKTWSIVHRLRFEESSTGEIEAYFLVRSIDSGFNLNPTYTKVKKVDIVSPFAFGEKIYSEVSDENKEVRVFIGNYQMVTQGFGFPSLVNVAFAERTENQFLRLVPE
jgi:hypothetical protein